MSDNLFEAADALILEAKPHLAIAKADEALGLAKERAPGLLKAAEIYIHAGKLAAASQMALEAVGLHRQSGDKAGEAKALLAIHRADLNDEEGCAIVAAEAAAKIYQELGETNNEGDAMLSVAAAHMRILEIRLRRCQIASQDQTAKALRAAKAAFALFEKGTSRSGTDACIKVLSDVLALNGLEPDAVLGNQDPMSFIDEVARGAYAGTKANQTKSGLPDHANLTGQKQQFDRQQFKWREAITGYSYQLMWEPRVSMGKTNPSFRASYNTLAMGTGARTAMLPFYAGMRAELGKDGVDSKGAGNMAIHIESSGSSFAMGSTIMTAMNTIAAMITMKLRKVTFVQVGESYPDHNCNKVDHIHCAPPVLAILRSARLENPTLEIGYVGTDLMTWMNDKTPLFSNIYDTQEDLETEVMYKKNQSYAATLVDVKMDQSIEFAKLGSRPKYTVK